MIEDSDQLCPPLADVKTKGDHGNKGQRYNSKNPDSPRKADFPDEKSYRRAYSEYHRVKNPNYFKEWSQKPEHAPRYCPTAGKPPPGCGKCGAEKIRAASGQYRCQPCYEKKEAARAAWRDRMVDLPARKEAKRIANEARARQAAVLTAQRATRDDEKQRRSEIRRLSMSRPSGLVEGFFLLPHERESIDSKMTKSGDCLIWSGPEDINIARFRCSPHRLLWFLEKGRAVTPGKVLDKTCATKGCVSPCHRKEADPQPAKPKVVYVPSYVPIPELTQAQLNYFHSRTNKDGDCWVWTGQKEEDGYGRMQIQGIVHASHRIAFFLANGGIDCSLQVHHACDSPYCVNPAHLSQGDHTKNFTDSIGRRRLMTPEYTERRVIPDEEQTAEIARLLRLGIKPQVISKKFGVAEEIIAGIGIDNNG